jgi:uncharacterized protein YfaS (alpha-2-macroglobulin family)
LTWWSGVAASGVRADLARRGPDGDWLPQYNPTTGQPLNRGIGGLGGLGALGGFGALGGGLGGFGAGGLPGMAERHPAKPAPPEPSKADAPRPLPVRQYFPETLLWQPALITDGHGRTTLEVPFADSITTWRLTASASSKGGLLGGVTAPLRVFQDFFVDLDLPVALTQNDEVAFPVAVYNYLKTPQTVTLELKPEPWFELIDGGPRRDLRLGPGEVAAARFRIRARQVGSFPLTVAARGGTASDAVKRSVEVLPDGKPVEQVFTDRLKGTATHKLTVPPTAVAGASKLLVKVYPGVVSQVLEGMEGLLRLPGG